MPQANAIFTPLSNPSYDPGNYGDPFLNDALLYQRGSSLLNSQQSDSFYNSFASGGDMTPNQVQTISYPAQNGVMSVLGGSATTNADGSLVSDGSSGDVSSVIGGSASSDTTGGLFGNALGGLNLGGALGTVGGLVSGATNAASGQTFFKYVSDWLGRAIVVVLGFVFVAAGLFMLHDKEGVVVNLGKAAKKGAEIVS